MTTSLFSVNLCTVGVMLWFLFIFLLFYHFSDAFGSSCELHEDVYTEKIMVCFGKTFWTLLFICGFIFTFASVRFVLDGVEWHEYSEQGGVPHRSVCPIWDPRETPSLQHQSDQSRLTRVSTVELLNGVEGNITWACFQWRREPSRGAPGTRLIPPPLSALCRGTIGLWLSTLGVTGHAVWRWLQWYGPCFWGQIH